MATQRKFEKFEPNDLILDCTFDPPVPGMVTEKLDDKADAYKCRLKGAANDVIIHARNLKRDI